MTAKHRRTSSSEPHMMFLFLSISLLATTLQGVQGEIDAEAPLESQCRPYIEKALKQLETGDTSAVNVHESTEDAVASNIYDTTKTDYSDSESIMLSEELSESTVSLILENTETVISTSAETEVITDQKNSDEMSSTSQELEIEQLETSTEEVTDEENINTVEEIQTIYKQTLESNQDIHIESQELNVDKEDISNVDSAESQKLEEKIQDVDNHIENKDNAKILSSDIKKKIEESTETQSEINSQEIIYNEITNENKENTETETILREHEEDIYTSVEETVDSTETHEQDQTESDENEKMNDVKQSKSSEEKSFDEEDNTSNEKGVSVEREDSTEKDVIEKDGSYEKYVEIARTENISIEAEHVSAEIEVSAELEHVPAETEHSSTENITSEEKIGSDGVDIANELNSAEQIIIESSETKVESIEQEPKMSKSEEVVIADEVNTQEQTIDEQQQDILDQKVEPQEQTDKIATGENMEETLPEEELMLDFDIPTDLRPRDHINQLLHLDEIYNENEVAMKKVADSVLRELKRLYENAIKPLEILYKYRDLSNRHFGDPEIFSKPLVLFMGPWSGGKSSIINYMLDNEYKPTSLRTGAEPSPAYFNILMWGEQPEVLDGTQMAADWTFSGLQKFGQGLEDRLRGLKIPSKLLEKINIVEIPGILEVRKQVSRVFPFNDACQWFIDRADIIFLVYDPSKLDVGPETEAILDQLKGREYQTRIILNKADQVKPEELMRVQGALIWNISPLMSSAQPPVMYTTSLWSRPYETGAPIRLLQAQERAFLRDLRTAVDKRIENKISSARRFAVRVRNHAKMVDCYLTTYYNHKSVFGNKKLVADQIIDHPQDYHIYEGLSTLTNISRYDLPDPDVYRDFFHLNPLYDFQQLSATCTYFRGCPINRLDVAIAYDLPELVGKYKKMTEQSLSTPSNS